MSSTPRERTRVLILIKGLGLGGAENLVLAASALWNRREFEYKVVYLLPWKDQLVSRLRNQDVETFCLDWHGPQSVRAIGRLRQFIADWRPDLIHSHLPVAGIIARVSAFNVKHVYTEHNVVDFYRQPTRGLNRLTYKRNDAVIVVSKSVAGSVRRYAGPPPIVVPNGVTVEQPSQTSIDQARRDLGIGVNTPLFVHVGNIRPHKGHSNLTEAVVLLVKNRPDSVVVSIGGEKREGDLDRVRQRANELGLDFHLRFLGRRNDALAYIAAADVVVNPSDIEGLPLSVLEALALARPVVATAVGGVPSVVRNEETGILVDPGSPRQLADAMLKALESPEASKWGQAGARLVAEKHGLDQMVATYEEIYREVLHE